ncbi:CLUMA_CG018587, isoform A [Clunio marinus]|uniref:CLUMA_CG018587, isoform A n=1 Tax=Clunio marinus TaxID=568069 RepID=A0A1J1IY74_9DIPT|nr:CLUMA_CG018587, isoform A [Clunio marinus]
MKIELYLNFQLRNFSMQSKLDLLLSFFKTSKLILTSLYAYVLNDIQHAQVKTAVQHLVQHNHKFYLLSYFMMLLNTWLQNAAEL